MINFGNNSEILKVSLDLQEIALIFNKAISNNYSVELRVEDMPNMDMDSILNTNIIKAGIDEEIKCLYIYASGLQLIFKYESYSLGTQSSSHSKFYFKSNGATLTVTVLM